MVLLHNESKNKQFQFQFQFPSICFCLKSVILPALASQRAKSLKRERPLEPFTGRLGGHRTSQKAPPTYLKIYHQGIPRLEKKEKIWPMGLSTNKKNVTQNAPRKFFVRITAPKYLDECANRTLK